MARRSSVVEENIVATATPQDQPCTALVVIRQDAIIAQAVAAIKSGNPVQPAIILEENHDSPEIPQPEPEPEEDFETYLERQAEELRIPVSCLRSIV